MPCKVQVEIDPFIAFHFANLPSSVSDMAGFPWSCFCLGTVITKLWRIYHIFHDPITTKKVLFIIRFSRLQRTSISSFDKFQPIHDWHLIILVLALSGIQIFLLFLGSAVPLLQPKLHLIQNAENPVLIEV